MKEQARNVAIGLTVLGALALMAAMIVIFAGMPQMFQGGYKLRMLFDGTHDAHEGDAVHLRGMRVGKITSVGFTDGDPAKGVTLSAYIDSDIELPGNTQAFIYTKGFAGGSYVELKPDGPPPVDPKTGKPYNTLPKDGSAVVQGRHEGMALLPEDLSRELRATMQQIGSLAKNLNDVLAPPAEEIGPPASAPATGTAPARAPAGVRGTLARLDAALQAVTDVLGSRENQANIKESLANLAQATGKAAEAMQALKDFTAEANKTVQDVGSRGGAAISRFDELAAKLIVAADQMSGVMTTINQTVAKIDAGEGTLGKLVNDPKLYNDLATATRELTGLLREMRQMLLKWDREGLPMKLK